MANRDAVSGFHFVRGDHNKILRVHINASYATALAVGDAVKLSGSADADGLPEIEALAATEVNALGIIVSIEPNYNDLTKTHSAASTAGYALVCTDPLAVYRVQADDVTADIAAADIGQLCDLVDAGVDTTRGTSGMELDTSEVTTSGQFRILRAVQRPDNEAFVTNAEYEVTWSEHMDVGAPVAV